MPERRIYAKAPITEALVDLRVALSAGVRVSDLEAIHKLIEESYPNKTARDIARGTFRVGDEVSASATRKQLGFLFSSADGKQIFQARRDGFTNSRLAPYDRWELFRDESRRLWQIYRDIAAPEAIRRLAIRYINRIDIPLPITDFKHFLRTVPEVSPVLPQDLSGMFMQLTIPHPEIGSVLLLTEALAESETPGAVSIILDIDLFREHDVPQNEDEIWSLFEKLHDRANQIFEACITDKTRELIA